MTEHDTKDRRRTWYMLRNRAKTRAEIQLYETSEFILNLRTSKYFERFLDEFEFEAHATMELEDVAREDVTLAEMKKAMDKADFILKEPLKRANRFTIEITFERKKKL